MVGLRDTDPEATVKAEDGTGTPIRPVPASTLAIEKQKWSGVKISLQQAGEAAVNAIVVRTQLGKDFRAGGVREGVDQFGALVKKVDFPKFVGGLIQNVFKAIVDATIQQMEAYADLLANVAKTVDQFAQDNITSNNARDWLANKYPEGMKLETDTMSGGFAEVRNDRVIILADTAERPEEIDRARAERARQRAEQRLAGRVQGDIDFARAAAALARAVARLQVAARAGG